LSHNGRMVRDACQDQHTHREPTISRPILHKPSADEHVPILRWSITTWNPVE
jgi:hypothetical protein